MTKYINRKGQGYLETVDEMEVKNKVDRHELYKLLFEYKLSDSSAVYYILKQGVVKNWKNEA
jgi:hypothetical protein